MSLEKTLLFQRKDNGNIIRYKCIKRDVSPIEVEDFFSTLYGMKLNSSEVNSRALKDGVTTQDVIHELRSILEDDKNPIIDFDGVLALFNTESVDPCVFTIPIKRFLNMYDVNKEKEYSQEEWEMKVDESIYTGKSAVLQKKKGETQSIQANTRILQNINLKNYAKRK